MKIGEYETHPAADVFPLLEGAEFRALVDDIVEHGLREPIWRVWADDPISPGTRKPLVLDGRNRLRACYEAGCRPEFRDYQGDDPIAFVVSLNLKRRNLSKQQAAMAFAELANLAHGSNQHQHTKVREEGAIAPSSLTLDEAADRAGVSREQIKRAKSVIKNAAPEIVEAVKAGDVTVSAAAAVARLPAEEQRAIAEAGPAAVKAKAREMREERARFVAAIESRSDMSDDEKAVVIGETSDDDVSEWDQESAVAAVYESIRDAFVTWPDGTSMAALETCLRQWVGRIEKRERGAA